MIVARAARSAVLTDAFEAGRIEPGEFHHDEHVSVAFELLRRYEFLDATKRYADRIRDLAARAGAPEKFNTTVTVAFMSLIAERRLCDGIDDYEAFRERNPDLYREDALAAHYRHDRLWSAAARQVFVLPREAATARKPGQ